MVGCVWHCSHPILYIWIRKRVWVIQTLPPQQATVSDRQWDRVYQEYYATHQLRDQTASSIAWIGSLQIFFLFAGALIGGPLFDRYGSKVSGHLSSCSLRVKRPPRLMLPR